MTDLTPVAPIPGATEITTATGVILWVYPMTLADQQALRTAAKRIYPEPNPKDYAQKLDPEESLIPETSGKESAAYETARIDFENAVNQYVTDGFYAGFVDSPQGRDTLINAYKHQLSLKRGVVPMPDNEWAATLKHAILQTAKDAAAVIAAGQALLPLTGGEVAEGVRIFRLSNERATPRKVPTRREVSSVSAAD